MLLLAVRKNYDTVINDEEVQSAVGKNDNASDLSATGSNKPRGAFAQFVCNQFCLVAEFDILKHSELISVAFVAKQHHKNNPNCLSTHFKNEPLRFGIFNSDAPCAQSNFVQ